uniref:Uncharacterized protein n=1 Tax=Anguilla anguilla TaxID=7936 RepID=A0A0E9T125_ANGAN
MSHPKHTTVSFFLSQRKSLECQKKERVEIKVELGGLVVGL